MDKNKITSWSIVLVIAMLISVFVLFAPANAGVSPDVGRSIGNNSDVIIGETNLRFVDENGDLIPSGKLESTWENSNINIDFSTPFDTTSPKVKDKLVKGKYRVVGDNGKIIYVYFALPDLYVETKVSGGNFSNKSKTVTQGSYIFFKAVTNLYHIKGPLPNYITYKLIDPNGLQRHRINDTYLIGDVSGDGVDYLMIDTADLDEFGTYTLSIETDPWTNNGLDKESSSITFKLIRLVERGAVTHIDINAEPKKQTVKEKVIITASTFPYTYIELNVTVGNALKVWFKNDRGDVVWGGHNASGWTDKDGNFKAAVYFNETGFYEITATEFIFGTSNSVKVQIVGFKAEVKTDKQAYYIGESVSISGSTNGGTDVTIKVDNEVLVAGLPIEGDKFSYIWETTGKETPGSHKISIWVSPQSNSETDPPDASVTIILLRGGLFAKPSADFVALGDDFKIEGTAPGRDRVDILTIAPRGGGGKGLGIETGGVLGARGLSYYCYFKDPDKDDFTTDTIKVSKKVDTGTYLIAVLSYGRDRVWGTSNSDNLLEVISDNYNTPLKIKTTDQIIDILKDKTINAPGSDDLLGIATIKVEDGFVSLDDIEDVPLGSDLKVKGITNRKVGTSIILTVEGMYANATKLKPKIATVEADDKNFYNKFEISFTTATANIGKYEVTADDGDGHTDTTTVNILLTVEPSVNVSATPSPTPVALTQGTNASAKTPPALTKPMTTTIPTPAAAATETEKQPGFVTVFTVAGLLLVTWLMLRIRRRQRKDKKR